MIIAQISDFHVVPPEQLVFGLVDSRQRLTNAVDAVLRLDPTPDAVLVTGDLTDGGYPEAYAFVAEQLNRISTPVFIVPGNHDNRPMLLAQFPNLPTIEAERFVAYAVERFPVRLIGLDSTVFEKHTADVCSRRAAWLDRTLGERPEAPTLLFLHHPPIETGVEAMDFLGFEWTRLLEEVVARHKQVLRVACGHHHRAITAAWAGTVVTVAPSTSHQFPTRLAHEALPGFVLETPGLLLHHWNGHSLVSHTIPIDPPPTTDFFTGNPALWKATMASLRDGSPLPPSDEYQ